MKNLGKRTKSIIGVIFSSVGMSLVYVGMNDFIRAGADSNTSTEFWYLSIVMIIVGGFVLLTGVISLLFVFATTNKNT